jgi:DHA1 family multidrug resistance protein-like MFS transporter
MPALMVLYVCQLFFSRLSGLYWLLQRPIYILTLAAFVLLQIPTALATNYGMLMAFFLT